MRVIIISWAQGFNVWAIFNWLICIKTIDYTFNEIKKNSMLH